MSIFVPVRVPRQMFIFDIQHFCTHDGPGVRTSVFLKGCPLHCQWCHNPESQSFNPQVLYHEPKCLHCGKCSGNHFEHPDVCQFGAMENCGREVSVEEIFTEVLQDESYYRYSGGGMTVTGGEPMAQAQETLSLLSLAHEAGISTAIETSGCGRKEDYLAILPFTDLFIWDIKLMDKDLFRQYTGGSLQHILNNLHEVSKCGAKLLLRFLFIPEIHLNDSIVQATRKLAEQFPGAEKEVIPYHVLGNSKRTKLGLPEIRFREPTPEEISEFRRLLGV